MDDYDNIINRNKPNLYSENVHLIIFTRGRFFLDIKRFSYLYFDIPFVDVYLLNFRTCHDD